MWPNNERGPESPESQEEYPFISGERAEMNHCASIPLVIIDKYDNAGWGYPGEGISLRWGKSNSCYKWIDKMQPDNYWSGTEYADNPDNAWNFNFNNGNQNINNKNNHFYAWAVRSGE